MADDSKKMWDLIVAPWHLDEHIQDFPAPAGATATIEPPLPDDTVPSRVTVLHRAIADMVAVERRGAAYGIFNTIYGILWFGGSAAMGALYGVSLASLAMFAIAAQLAAIPLLLYVRRTV